MEKAVPFYVDLRGSAVDGDHHEDSKGNVLLEQGGTLQELAVLIVEVYKGGIHPRYVGGETCVRHLVDLIKVLLARPIIKRI